jgi:hypothetical protein
LTHQYRIVIGRATIRSVGADLDTADVDDRFRPALPSPQLACVADGNCPRVTRREEPHIARQGVIAETNRR